MYPDEDTAPLVDVDTFWHYHILDTMKYAADCEQAFGYFLHHYPYVGMRGDDEQFRVDGGNRMRDLYEATFGEAYPGAVAATDAAFCASPHGKDIAFCASPHTPAGIKADTAFCASPHGKDVAFCASPHGKDVAFCASPHGKDVAFCASPHARIETAANA
jgi:putative hemolysin